MIHPQLDKTKKPFVIGLDLDGVIIDHTRNKIKLAKAEGWTLHAKQTPGDILKAIIPHAILTGMQQKLYDLPAVALTASLMPGVPRVLDQIKKKRVPYYLISRRKIPEWATLLLKIYGLWPKYFDEYNTFFVNEPEDKNKQAVKLGVTHYVDDDISVLEKLTDVKNKILFDPHRAFRNTDWFVRAASWQSLGKILKLF